MQIKEINNDQDNIDVVFKVKNKNRVERQNRLFKRRMTIIVVVLIIAALVAGYYFSPYSNIREVQVTGNYYFNDEEVISLSEIEINNDKFVLNTDSAIENKLMTSNYFSGVNVKHRLFNIIVIEVVENKIVFYSSNNEINVYFSNGEKIGITEDNFKLISYCPGINDFEESRFKELAEKMDVLDIESVNMISEIYPYSTTYDANMIDLLMVNGKHIFMNPESLDVLNSYSELSKVLTETDECLYVDEISKGVFSSACPWSEETVEDETVAEDNESTNE